jgi:hypothetical protein
MRRKKKRAPPLKAPERPIREEKDEGYGGSHGYGPGHGGPSGPGDVPGNATPQGPATVVPTPDADDTSPDD